MLLSEATDIFCVSDKQKGSRIFSSTYEAGVLEA